MSYTVGLDLGHGSNTFPPSKGVYRNSKGYAEHSFNAKLGVEIKKLLEYNGFKVVMAQEPNKPDVPLTTRTNLYNKKNVDIVFSVHANAGVSSASGRCAFYWHTSNSSKKLATYVIEEIKKKGYSTHGNGLHASMRGSWTDLHICRETKMPAVLVEHGFMTNDEDFELIFGSKQNQYVKDMAEADVRAICRYFGKTFKKPSSSSSSSSKSSSKSSSTKTKLYRVRKSWKDAKSQLGAFSSLTNAKNLVNKNPSYKVYDESGKVVYSVSKSSTSTKKTATSKSTTTKGNYAGGDPNTTSVVDYLKSIKVDSSFANRAKIAKELGISNYRGTPSQNIELLKRMRNSAPAKSAPKKVAPKNKYAGGDPKTYSVVDYLKSIKVDSSFANRAKIAKELGIKNYKGTPAQNLTLLKKMRGF